MTILNKLPPPAIVPGDADAAREMIFRFQTVQPIPALSYIRKHVDELIGDLKLVKRSNDDSFSKWKVIDYNYNTHTLHAVVGSPGNVTPACEQAIRRDSLMHIITLFSNRRFVKGECDNFSCFLIKKLDKGLVPGSSQVSTAHLDKFLNKIKNGTVKSVADKVLSKQAKVSGIPLVLPSPPTAMAPAPLPQPAVPPLQGRVSFCKNLMQCISDCLKRIRNVFKRVLGC